VARHRYTALMVQADNDLDPGEGGNVPKPRTAGDTAAVAQSERESYHQPMAKAHNFELHESEVALEIEDQETLAAIDEGVQQAHTGQTVSSEHVRSLLPKWVSASNTRN
jgi:predicted transcriptional regulator